LEGSYADKKLLNVASDCSHNELCALREWIDGWPVSAALLSRRGDAIHPRAEPKWAFSRRFSAPNHKKIKIHWQFYLESARNKLYYRYKRAFPV
jgi:hypothetical protein